MSYDESTQQESGWSLKWVIMALMILVAFLCWGLAAAGYARANFGWRENAGVEDFKQLTGGRENISPRRGRSVMVAMAIKALLEFLWNGLVQLPRFPWVIGHAFTKSIWVVIVFGVLECLLGFMWWKLAALDKELAKESRRRLPY